MATSGGGGDDERRPPRALLEAAIGGVQQSMHGTDTQVPQAAALSLKDALAQLTRAIAVLRPDKAVLRTLIDRIDDISARRGFTSTEATKIVRLALRGAGTRLPSTVTSVRLLKTIRPAKGHIFGEPFVLVILGALGGTGDNVIDRSGLKLAVEEAIEGNIDDEGGSSDNSDGDDDSAIAVRADKLRRRKRVDVRVQGIALRLLVLLFAPPSLSLPLDDPADDNGPSTSNLGVTSNAALPTPLLSPKARRTLDRCYGVLFHYIEYQTLRPFLCHLLCFLTRRKHVKPYRVLKVTALRSKLPTDAPLAALIGVFARHVPSMLFSQAELAAKEDPGELGAASGLRYPDVRWLSAVVDLWQGRTSHTPSDQLDEVERIKRRRLANAAAPLGRSDQLAAAGPSCTYLNIPQKLHLATAMNSYTELGFHLDALHMPDRISVGLFDHVTAAALLASYDDKTLGRVSERIEHWFISALSDEIGLHHMEADVDAATIQVRTDVSQRKVAAILAAQARWTELTGSLSRRLQSFASRLLALPVWTSFGEAERKQMLRLISFVAPDKEDHFTQEISRRLCTIALDVASDKDASDVMACMTGILTHWSQHDWASDLRALERHGRIRWGSVRITRDMDIAATVSSLASTATQLGDALLQLYPASLLMEHACMQLHAALFSTDMIGLHTIALPANMMLYRPLFSTHGAIMSLSRIFGVVHSVRLLHQDFLAARLGADERGDADARRRLPTVMREREDAFFDESCSDAINDCVILFVDLVWRNNGFASVIAGNNTDLGLRTPFFEKLAARCHGRGDELERLGSASHSAHLGILMEAYANSLVPRSQQTHAAALPIHGPITPVNLKSARAKDFPNISHRDFRDGFLTALADYSADGIRGLLNTTVTRFIRGQILDESTILA